MDCERTQLERVDQTISHTYMPSCLYKCHIIAMFARTPEISYLKQNPEALLSRAQTGVVRFHQSFPPPTFLVIS